MFIQKISLKNITVFDTLDMQFSDGINVFIGPNGVGKTHLLKILYSACCAADPKVSFSNKIVSCFAPDEHRISRLVRRKQGNNDASIDITSKNEKIGKLLSNSKTFNSKTLSASFSNKTSKWDSEVAGEEGWEKQREGLSSVFIPAKEILSHSYNLNAAVAMNNVFFDDTYLDVINAAKIKVSSGKDAAIKKTLLSQIEAIIEGKVFFDKERDEFYLKHGNTKIEFNLVAEGIRKIALLWQLVKNGVLVSGSVLFWDEPEANINPIHIPIIAEILLNLQQNGVQIFISTHDYFLNKYLEVKRQTSDKVMFHSFFYDEDHTVAVESSPHFKELTHNSILDTFISLYQEEIDKVMES
ncbi:MAG: AAA family ATPase [Negativibacillus sp.]|jgi:ABC-type Mn2+/Zn2+ transport system ATPase subunit